MESLFKVGDKVKVVGGQADSARRNQGYVGIITAIGTWRQEPTDMYFHTCGRDYYRIDDEVVAWDKDLVLVEGKNEPVGFVTKDSGKRNEFASGMMRDTEDDKPLYTLIPTWMLRRWAELMGRGAKKYGRDNWKKANGEEELKRFKDSAYRHFIQWLDGETDEDHAAAIFFNVTGAEYVKQRIERGDKA